MNIYHIIDHSGFGSLHKLIIPLCEKYKNNIIFTPYLKKYKLTNSHIKKISKDKNSIIIIHSTGRNKTIYIDKLNHLFKNNKVFIFMHVSINYEMYKNRMNFIERLYNICNERKITILTPSSEVTNQYINYGFSAKTIQIGIPDLNDEYYFKFTNRNAKYYDKIITVCASENIPYYGAKGIDNFIRLVSKENISKKSLIAGINNYNNCDIIMKRFNEKDFLNVLCHSKAYIQLSIFESYNITAIQAKRFKIPVILLNAEGNSSCMNGNTYKNIKEITQKMKEVINGIVDSKTINSNYNDSVLRESLENFNNNLLDLFKEV